MPPAANLTPPTTTRRRLALRSAVYLLLAFPLLVMVYQGLPVPLLPHSPLMYGAVVAALLLSLAHVLMRREGRSLADLGLKVSSRALGQLGLGLLGGSLLFGLATLLLSLVLHIDWRMKATLLPVAISSSLLFHLVTNACEELAWRGYAFDGLLRSFGHWPAQLIAALVAAAFHVLCGWSWQVALISTTAGSLMFALVFVRWRSVPAAVGVHASWNWTRDLIMSPGATTALLDVQGPQHWSAAQWQVAQAIYVGATLAACGGLLMSMRPRPQRMTATGVRP